MGTPIEQGNSLGPKSGAALREAGVSTVEELVELGWEEALLRLVELSPRFVNLNMAYALIAAAEDVHWQALSTGQKAKARAVVERLRRRR